MKKVSDSAREATDQGRFAAREFIAQYVRETGLSPSAEFAYEIGYLRGRSDAARETIKMFDEIAREREETRKEIDADSDADSE